ncbi:MAG: flagellar basal-body rod protein FlgG [Phycisphaerales bacterium JB065]
MATISLYSASTGMNALNTRLDVIANNLANVNTDGFKGSRANFQDLLYQEKRLPGVENANGDRSPTGLYVGLGVKVSGTQIDFREGAPIQTGKELDMLIEGDGFFQVRVEDSVSETGIAYTRAGNFVKNADGDLVLGNDLGYRLEPGITIPEDAAKIEIGTDGTVYALFNGDTDPQEIGQIEIANFVNPTGLSQIGGNLFVETAASGQAITGEPGTERFGKIRAGYLEGSNVDPTRELIELIRTQRAFEMNSQVVRASDETLQAIGQLRR